MEGIKELSEVFPAYNVNIIPLQDLKEETQWNEPVLHLKSFCSMCGEGKIITGGPFGRAFKRYLAERGPLHHRFRIICCQTPLRAIGEYADFRDFAYHSYDVIHVPDAAAANCLYINGTIIRRATDEFPESGKVFETHESLCLENQIELEYDELAKVDGALTCCSLLI